jgi:hypothetical protein
LLHTNNGFCWLKLGVPTKAHNGFYWLKLGIPTKAQGIGSGTSGGYIFTNVLLDYGGNLVGDKHGNFMGDMLGNGSQTVFDMYVDINTKK